MVQLQFGLRCPEKLRFPLNIFPENRSIADSCNKFVNPVYILLDCTIQYDMSSVYSSTKKGVELFHLATCIERNLLQLSVFSQQLVLLCRKQLAGDGSAGISLSYKIENHAQDVQFNWYYSLITLSDSSEVFSHVPSLISGRTQFAYFSFLSYH